MCDPTAIAVASLATSVGGELAGAKAKNKAAKANKASALEALRLGNTDVNARIREEAAAAAMAQRAVTTAGTANVSTVAASAAESGVAGASVDALVGEVLRQQGVATDTITQNLEMVKAQAERQKQGLAAEARSRIAGVQPANPTATGLGIAGAGISFLNQYRLLNPPK